MTTTAIKFVKCDGCGLKSPTNPCELCAANDTVFAALKAFKDFISQTDREGPTMKVCTDHRKRAEDFFVLAKKAGFNV